MLILIRSKRRNPSKRVKKLLTNVHFRPKADNQGSSITSTKCKTYFPIFYTFPFSFFLDVYA
ncbi:MAG: hypothetical protein V3U54_09960, partial [Thermodesulfobacteriota bacterium]